MAGGDGACMGCGEKTAVHLVTSSIEALMQPRVEKLLTHVDGLIADLDKQARELMASEVDLTDAAEQPGDHADVQLSGDKKETLRLLTESIEQRSANLSPETREALRRNLEIIDRAIADIRAALAEDPDAAGSEMLAAMYQQKLQLLWRVSRLSSS